MFTKTQQTLGLLLVILFLAGVLFIEIVSEDTNYKEASEPTMTECFDRLEYYDPVRGGAIEVFKVAGEWYLARNSELIGRYERYYIMKGDKPSIDDIAR